MRRISVVVPIYNEADNLPELARRLRQSARQWGCDYEVLAVNDGSTDGSAALLDQFAQDDRRWRVLHFSRNFGQQMAFSAGLHYANGDAIVLMDADLQDPPELIEALLRQWRLGHQVVYAVRQNRQESWWLRSCYRLYYRLWRRLSPAPLPLDAGDFCLLDRQAADVLRALPEHSRMLRGLRAWIGFSQVGVPYDRPARFAGATKYTLIRLLKLAVDGFIGFCPAPLRLASLAGAGLVGSAVVVPLLLLLMRGLGGMNWTGIGLVSWLTALAGVQLLLLGVVGEYLLRVFDEVRRRPPWIIARATGVEPTYDGPAIGWFADRADGEETNAAPDPRWWATTSSP